MAKNKSKKQKRNAKVKAKNKKHFHFHSVKELFRVDGRGLKLRMPNTEQRTNYIQALIDDFTAKIGD